GDFGVCGGDAGEDIMVGLGRLVRIDDTLVRTVLREGAADAVVETEQRTDAGGVLPYDVTVRRKVTENAGAIVIVVAELGDPHQGRHPDFQARDRDEDV